MTDLYWLFLMVYLLYAIECILWTPYSTETFLRSLRSGWYICRTNWALDGIRKSIVVAPVFLPLGRSLTCSKPIVWPAKTGFFIDESAAISIASNSKSSQFFEYDKIRDINCVGDRLLIDNTAIAEFPANSIAKDWKKFLSLLRDSSKSKRSELIATRLSASLCRSSSILKCSDVVSSRNRLVWLCHIQTFTILLGFPAATIITGLASSWIIIVVFLVTVGVLISIEVNRACLIGNSCLRDNRWRMVTYTLLSPFGAARAVDQIQQFSLYPLDPIAVASGLCCRTEYRRYVRQILRENLLPRTPRILGIPYEHMEELRWSRMLWIRCIASLLSETSDSSCLVLKSPDRLYEDERSYCPRCCTTYAIKEGLCSECGIDLVRIGTDLNVLY